MKDKASILYLVPGLGTDRRIFENLLQHLNLEGIDVYPLDFIEPARFNEPMVDYAQRLKATLPDEDAPCYILGLSLGGMIAVELAKILNCRQLILISTIKVEDEAPWYFRPMRKLPLYYLVPGWSTRAFLPRLAKLLKITNQEHSRKFHQMLKDRSNEHLRWARGAAVGWQNTEKPENVLHIHGDKDHIFKHEKANPDVLIKGGTHNMIMDRAPEIAEIINEKGLLGNDS